MSKLLDILRSNREEREQGNSNSNSNPNPTEVTAITNSRPSLKASPTLISSEGLSPLQHGLVMAYVTRIPNKVQAMLPKVPGILGKLQGPLKIVGLDITDEQVSKLKVLEKTPEEIVTSIGAEQLHAIAAALCNMVEHLLAMDRSQGIGTGNGSPGPTGFEPDNSSRGVEIGQVNADTSVSGTETAIKSPDAIPVH